MFYFWPHIVSNKGYLRLTQLAATTTLVLLQTVELPKICQKLPIESFTRTIILLFLFMVLQK